ncbi:MULTISPECIES: GNAT family N-acetyltransferase [unclassified Bosea (in: a-proteobacteria)]|uniref:GNAT family N-acetyltransferase n=1 Tax=unclassified Bosea (in: a-proteobacteria) TaxID=2653178 RepID=UPI000F74C544|nr:MULTISPECIES: GNAT family N-acetyltransferase [unclassified Bosea (in: a-proteobacteria)]AZO80646.1 GNAT family N-acetyltransferase [Bosea sp. Tri-49]RXT25607.1 GNAT family N-acetyltransferase [Bosea sp. Tri-39]RXT30848.1 GNAT family N-acetyltransferase [Bosea sp. Tri-54]
MRGSTGYNSRRARAIRLETERLVLDLHGVEHFEPLCQMWGDAAVVHHIGQPSTPQEAWMRLLRYRGLWPLLGYGYWALTEKTSGRFVGDLGFADFHRAIEPPIRGIPEAGWVLASWAHGRGFASEALTAALAWLDRQSEHEGAVCLIAPGNQPSLRLARRFEFRDERIVSFSGHETVLLRRARATQG